MDNKQRTVEPKHKRAGKRSIERQKRRIRTAFFFVFLAVFAVSAYMFVNNALEYREAEDSYSDLRMSIQMNAFNKSQTDAKEQMLPENTQDTSAADINVLTGDANIPTESSNTVAENTNIPAENANTSAEKTNAAVEKTNTAVENIPSEDGSAELNAAESISTVIGSENSGMPVQSVVPVNQNDAVPQRTVAMDFAELQSINNEIVAWIRADGTNIDYPVLHTDNNDYYMNHLYNRAGNSSGSIFIDYRNIGDFSDKNTVLYGHHMKNGSMFKSLEEYKDQEFYDANPVMNICTPNGDFSVELISGTVENGSKQFMKFYFDTDEEFMDYVNSFRARSTFQSDTVVEPGDRLVSMCTCSYEVSNARYLVMGKLVEQYD